LRRPSLPGYSFTLTYPEDAFAFVKNYIEDSGSHSEDFRAGILAGADAALAAKHLVSDTIEALGIKKLPSKPPV
jgi:hypothetical protein